MARSVLAGFPKVPPPGRPGDPGLLGPGSAAWRVNGEMALLAVGQRVLLMQVAHPLVAAGVARHSDFRTDPYARLWATLEAMLSITFGDAEASRLAAERVNRVHRAVRGTTGDGTAYRALDPELLRWVHATIVDGGLVAYERFVGPVPPAGAERYHQDMKRVAAVLRLPPDEVPDTVRDLRRYLDETVAGLVVTDEARAIAHDVLWPPVPPLLRPLAAALRLVTVELLPPRLRAGYGLPDPSPLARVTAGVLTATSRTLVPLLPAALRRWPHAREAARRTAPSR